MSVSSERVSADVTGSTAVLIVGAGPTGLTLACELARRSIPFRLVEVAAGPNEGSRGKGVQPRTLEVLDDLGVVDEVIAHGRFAMPIRSVQPDGTVRSGGAAPADLQDRPDIPYTTSLVTPEWRIERVLRARLAQLGGRIEFSTTLVSIEQTVDVVTATVAREGRMSTIRAAWVVGADGGHSTVRKQAGIAFSGDTLEDVRMLVADVALSGLEPDAWTMWRSETGFVSLCPLPGTELFQYQASIAPGQNPDTALPNLQAILERRTGRTDIRLAEPGWRSLWRANIRLADHYRAGRVLLAGDAAHIHSPAGGQGMNTGIQDAHNLGWKLAEVVRGATSALLDSYEAERRPVAEHVLALSNVRLQQTIRTGQMDTRRDASTLQLDIGYRDSPLVRDDRADDAVLRAGDRAPDATGLHTVEGERRLFELTRGGRFTLLSWAPNAAERADDPELRVLQVVDASKRAGELVDSLGHLGAAYAASERTLVLIRPDGYVARISDTGDLTAVLAQRTSTG